MRTAVLENVQIQRRSPGTGELEPIPLTEWQQLITSDPDLEPLDHILGRNPRTGNPVRVLLQGGARWTRNPESDPLPFYWENGEIVARSADQHTVQKARELAAKLGAECRISVD